MPIPLTAGHFIEKLQKKLANYNLSTLLVLTIQTNRDPLGIYEEGNRSENKQIWIIVAKFHKKERMQSVCCKLTLIYFSEV